MPWYDYKCIHCGYHEELSLMAPPPEMVYSERICDQQDPDPELDVCEMKRQWGSTFGIGRVEGAGFSPARFPKT